MKHLGPKQDPLLKENAMGSGGRSYVKSWTKNPLENLATGGNVALYKGALAAAGAKGPTSTSLGLPEILPGAQKLKGFDMPQSSQEAEMQMIQRQALIASGQAPSYSQMAFNQNLDATGRQAMALAASQRGASNPMLAFRQAQIGNQQAQLEGAQQAALMAEQEKRQADQLIGQQVASQRGVAFQQAAANQQAQQAQRAQNMQLIAGLGGTAASLAMGGGGMGAPQAPVPLGATGLSPDAAGGTTGYSRSYLASDARVKKNVTPAPNASSEIEAFVRALNPKQFEYTDPQFGTGEKLGVMAQALEKTKVGKTMVDTAPDGTKVIDSNKAIGAILAGMADMNKKLSKLEKA